MIAVLSSLALFASGFVVGPVVADSVWHQGFQRASAESTCQAPDDETPWQESFSGQREWTPSWAKWANDGQGGWVCQRFIIWAKSAAPEEQPEPNFYSCAQWNGPPDPLAYVEFDGVYVLPAGSPIYSDSDCSNPLGFATVANGAVYASLLSEANTLCMTINASYRATKFTGIGTNVWLCA